MSYPSAFTYSISKSLGWSHVFGAQLRTFSCLGLAMLLSSRGSKEIANCSPASSSASLELQSLCNRKRGNGKGFPPFLHHLAIGSNSGPLESVPALPFLAHQSPDAESSLGVLVGHGQGRCLQPALDLIVPCNFASSARDHYLTRFLKFPQAAQIRTEHWLEKDCSSCQVSWGK